MRCDQASAEGMPDSLKGADGSTPHQCRGQAERRLLVFLLPFRFLLAFDPLFLLFTLLSFFSLFCVWASSNHHILMVVGVLALVSLALVGMLALASFALVGMLELALVRMVLALERVLALALVRMLVLALVRMLALALVRMLVLASVRMLGLALVRMLALASSGDDESDDDESEAADTHMHQVAERWWRLPPDREARCPL